MEILCVPCGVSMKVGQTKKGPNDGSMALKFGCPNCKSTIALLTGPEESKLIKSLNISAGSAKSAPAKPAKPEIVWTKDAEARMENVPVFVRPMAKSGIEKYAKEKGVTEITPEIMDAARETMGM